jgi:ABC-type transport system involved in cytochrome c biogenesis permease subunit
MSDPSLAELADTLVWLTVLSYLAAAVLLGLEFGYRVRWLGLAGVAVAVAGLALNAGVAGARGLAAGRVPWGNLYEVSVLLGLLLVAGYLIWAWRRPEARSLGPFVLLPAVLAIAAGGLLAYVPVGPLVPALNSGWLRIHVAAAITGCSLLALSGLCSALFLGKDRMEGRAQARPPLVAGGAQTVDWPQARRQLARHGDPPTQVEGDADGDLRARGGPARSLWERLPAARTLDELAYRTTAFAFPVWTFGIIAGAIWGQARTAFDTSTSGDSSMHSRRSRRRSHMTPTGARLDKGPPDAACSPRRGAGRRRLRRPARAPVRPPAPTA